jgi:hypothetical protein
VTATRILLAAAWNRRRMTFPYDAACRSCRVANPLVLVERARGELCYRCDSEDRGLSGLEGQHLGGRPSPFAPVTIDGNPHRILTYMQEAWRRAKIAPGSPAATLFDLLALLLVLATWEPDERATDER